MLAGLHAEGGVKVVKAKASEAERFRAWCALQGDDFNVAKVPTLMLFTKGRPVKTHVGKIEPEELNEFVGRVVPTGAYM